MVEADKIEELVPVSHPEVRKLFGIEQSGDPDQVVRRMVRQGVPHLRIGRRIRFSLPSLKAWCAEKIANSIAASTALNETSASAGAQ